MARLKDLNSRMPGDDCSDVMRIKQLDSEFVVLKQVNSCFHYNSFAYI